MAPRKLKSCCCNGSAGDRRTRPCSCRNPCCRVPPAAPCGCGCRSDFCNNHCSCGKSQSRKSSSRRSIRSRSSQSSSRKREGPAGWGKPFQVRKSRDEDEYEDEEEFSSVESESSHGSSSSSDSCDPNDSLLQCQMQLDNFACRVRNMKRQCYCGVKQHNRGCCDFLRPGDLHVPNGSLFQYKFDTRGRPQNREAKAVHSTLRLEGRIK